MWKKTTPLHHGVNCFPLRLLFLMGAVLGGDFSWAMWPVDPPLETAYVDFENLSIAVSGKAPPDFLVPSALQSRSNAERLARLNAAERLFLLIRELRLSRSLQLKECAPEEQLREKLANLLLSQRPEAHWRFVDGGQSFFFKLPLSSLAPLCPKLAKAMAQLPPLSAKGVLATHSETKQGETKQGETKQGETKQGETKQGETKQGETKQGETKMLWVVPPLLEVSLEPCLFPVLFSEDAQFFLDTAAENYFVVWSTQTPAAVQNPGPLEKGVLSHKTIGENSGIWAVQAIQRDSCSFELSNEVAAELNLKIHAKQLGRMIVVASQRKAK